MARLSVTALLLLLSTACATTPARNKDINRRFVEEVYNQHQLDRIPLYVAPDFVDRSPGAPPNAKGPDFVIEQAKGTLALLPDVKMTIERMVAEGELVTIHWSARGTSAAAGSAPAGKEVSFQGISVFRMRDGKIIESWDLVDRLGLFRQLGFKLVPPG